MASATQRFNQLIRTQAVVRADDLEQQGIPRNYLVRGLRAGKLERIGRGLYRGIGGPLSENQTLVEVSKKIPQAVICLSSALRFHHLTTQAPFEVWIALKRGAWTPTSDYPPVRVVRFSPASLKFGVQERKVQGGIIRVYSPAKTIADCFKFRSKVGTDVALEALREGLRSRNASVDEIWEAAKICRVANVMRPYMESLI
jgi:predicted transcriptional regulator of viral defense system